MTENELREELERGKKAGAEPCSCRGRVCVCTTVATASRYAQDALPVHKDDAAFWTGFAIARRAREAA